MGSPAIVMGDRVTGMCAPHQIPNPTSGVPQPGPPMPFSAPVVQAVAPTVLIGGKPAVIMGSSGFNTPPHVGLHPADPYMVPAMQIGRIASGSPTVLIEGKAAASTSATATMCMSPGTLVPSVMTVLIG
jgi:uncharacterized Zn-binding protein involved in type VI secretion